EPFIRRCHELFMRFCYFRAEARAVRLHNLPLYQVLSRFTDKYVPSVLRQQAGPIKHHQSAGCCERPGMGTPDKLGDVIGRCNGFADRINDSLRLHRRNILNGFIKKQIRIAAKVPRFHNGLHYWMPIGRAESPSVWINGKPELAFASCYLKLECLWVKPAICRGLG